MHDIDHTYNLTLQGGWQEEILRNLYSFLSMIQTAQKSRSPCAARSFTTCLKHSITEPYAPFQVPKGMDLTFKLYQAS